MTELFPDTMGDLRTWLRTQTDDLLDGRVFFHFTPATKFPAMRIYEAGGGPDGGEAPVENLRVALDIWGGAIRGPSNGGGTYADVVAIVRRLKSRLHELSGPIGSTTFVLNADVTGVVPATDPDGGAPRQIVTASLTVRNS